MCTPDNDIELIISKYLSHEASPEEMEALRLWLEASPDNCRAFMERKSLIAASHPAFAPEDIDVDEALRSVMGRIDTPRRRPLMHRLGRAAAVLALPLAVACAWLCYKAFDTSDITSQTLSTPFGTLSEVVLPDGSSVWLNAGSSISFPSRFTEDVREVSMSGEAYFRVRADRKHPFVVRTASLSVEATGTEFNVNAYRSDTVASVTLETGKVNVTLPDDESVGLTPGEKLDFSIAADSYAVNRTDTYKWCSWKDGILNFRDDPLRFVFKRLGQTYNVDFVFDDPNLGEYSYKATFEGESLGEILHLLEMSAPIRCKVVGDTIDGRFARRRIEVSRIQER